MVPVSAGKACELDRWKTVLEIFYYTHKYEPQEQIINPKKVLITQFMFDAFYNTSKTTTTKSFVILPANQPRKNPHNSHNVLAWHAALVTHYPLFFHAGG